LDFPPSSAPVRHRCHAKATGEAAGGVGEGAERLPRTAEEQQRGLGEGDGVHKWGGTQWLDG